MELEAGWHQAFLSHTNIDYKPESGNVSRFDSYLNGVQVELYDIVPVENKPVVCKKGCDGKEVCEDPDAPSGGTSPSSSPSSARMSSRLARSTVSGSSAGTNVAADASQESMYWQCNFGLFRGLPGVPGGQIEIVEEDFTERLWSPSALLFRHVLHSKLLKPTEGLSNNCMVAVQKGSLLAYYFITQGEEDNGSVGNIGYNTRLTNRARMLGEDFTPVVSNPVYIEVAEANGSKVVYSVETGDPVRFTASSGQQLTEADFHAFMDVVYAEDGSLRQVSNISDGLASVQDVTEAGYTLALYLPSQVGAKDETTGLYAVTGEPFKRFVFARNEEGDKASVTERTPGRNDFVTTWWKNGEVWCLGKGTGDSAIYTVRTRTEASEKEWNLLTEVQMGEEGMAVSSLMESYKSTPQGNLLMSRTEGYGSGMARTTSYEYSANGVLTKETRPDGSEVKYEQDRLGRQTLVSTPYKGFAEKRVKTSYCEAKFNDHDPVEMTTILRQKNKADVQLIQTLYTYTEENDVRRVEERTTALGAEGTRLEVTETWLASAPNPYARGRLKMRQGIDGVQRVYSYEHAIRHGAAYTVTEETQIDGAPVPGQSHRMVSFISAEGNTVRTEEYILLTDGTWSLLDSADYEFDLQNRWTRKTRGNGRITERELMCDGRPLWEKDEDGILTSYGYDSARRLVEMIRSATETTPETIISYTRDALGRAVEERKDIGAMSTVRRTAYDVLGRVSSETDELGRITAYAYSDDGLEVTVTTTAGATIVTTYNTDGSIREQSGTGQRNLVYVSDLVSDGIRTTELLPGSGGEQPSVVVSKKITDGFGSVIRIGTANCSNSCYYERFLYNTKGQLTRRGVDNMAPTLYEYDAFGNEIKETWKLEATPNLSNSRITTYSYAVERKEDGVYRITLTTKNNGKGTTYQEKIEKLISRFSSVQESKILSTDGRGNVMTAWTEYGTGTERLQKSSVSTSTVMAITKTVDGFTVSQTDYEGITTSQQRTYTVTGTIHVSSDSRGNQTISHMDLAGRVISVTDAAGNITTTAYDSLTGNRSIVTDSQGNTACYTYDVRGRKTAEWGTGIQPALFTYDDANRMTSVTTFRVKDGVIATDPTGRTDGDTTTWEYHDASGLELKKTYADGTHEDREYNALNMLVKKTNARGIVTTYTWNTNKGVCYRIKYSDDTLTQDFVYNNVANLYRITDASGTRNITYNIYNEQETDAIEVNGDKHTITEKRDSFGRSSGYIHDKSGTVLQTIATDYDSTGRLSTSSFRHSDGSVQAFTYGYVPGTRLLHSIAHPNGITVTYTYDENRDLITAINTVKDNTDIVLRGYTYNALGQLITRTQNRQGESRNDNFGYNSRGELISATLGTSPYDYQYEYDNIGNRISSQEYGNQLDYTTNPLNQYTSTIPHIGTNSIFNTIDTLPDAFEAKYDETGNQTLIKTSTGIWSVAYDANNRPISFISENGQTIITCGYDFLGRRFEKKVVLNGSVILHHRYIYRGYLQIAALDMTLPNRTPLRFIHWDPVEQQNSRPLSICKDNTWYTYAHDLTKNVTELYTSDGVLAAAYDYTPFGTVDATGSTEQPIQWSSEFYDLELGLVYYNYRHYNPNDGRWITRDPSNEQDGWNLYRFIKNNCYTFIDILGKKLEKLDLSSDQIPLEFVRNFPDYIGGETKLDVEVGIKKEKDEDDEEKKKPVIFIRKQELTIRINANLGTDPNAGKHSFTIKGHKQTTEWHERHHAALYIEGWNNGIEYVNEREKSVCEKCYIYQESIIENEFKLMVNKYQLENKRFDKEYSNEDTAPIIQALQMEFISLTIQLAILENLKESMSCE